MYTTQILADHLMTYPSAALPAEARQSALCCILDAVTAAVVGSEIGGAQVARAIARQEFGVGRAPIWFTGESQGTTAAAFCNAASASTLDFDDGHRGARGHPGAAVVPVALSVACETDASADDILDAVALGYEAGIRIAVAQNPDAIKSRQSGRWTGYGAVAAAGRLYGTGPAALAQALSIAGVLAPNQEANGSSGYAKCTGNDVKEGIPWSVVTGLLALQLAERGFTGPLDLLDHHSHFDPLVIAASFEQPMEISNVYFKPYSCCRYIHPALDALAAVFRRVDFTPKKVVSVDVHTFQWALRLANSVSPKTLTDIQYSLPYCIAIAAIDGIAALAPIGEAQLARPDLCDFARKVRLLVDHDIDSRFPTETLAYLSLHTSDGGTVTSDVTAPRGDKARPMDWDKLVDKFRGATRKKLSPKAQRTILNGLSAMNRGDAAPFLKCLCMPLIQ
ncbi:MmgE/PrpD family 2-methylcitrate dehydratase protein [Rhizobium gallicum]|uniref:MmgE/PrpD family 2-methylcitrate dehydratase protein n=1 Tax=Rhizobium gallicum TaxID=56730 RepID=A0A1L5NLU2_9HYPH|nr:MmgE/PrpD family protein [Rhizobium gallicum]APO68847.1 MmgE/PrpD family 2-methylcitrate dehydratase protein [Rhizobium gallicum]